MELHDAGHRRRRIRDAFRDLRRFVRRITFLMELTMADVKALSAKIEALDAFVVQDEADDDANEVALQAVIVDLRAQLAAGAGDLQPQIDAIDAVIAKLHTPAPVPQG